MYVYLLATLDTKGREIDFIRQRLSREQVAVRVVDTGCLGEPLISADIPREEVFLAAGTTLQEVRQRADRGQAVALAARGAAQIVRSHFEQGSVAGVLGIGGSAGTTIASAAMGRLPLGVPKVLVSTLASGDVRAFVGAKDVVMINPVVDISGLNRISRTVLGEAAAAMAGMVKFATDSAVPEDKPLVAATMFGVTTPCVERAREVLEQGGYEVLVFHATGAGGQAMESLASDRLIVGVLDITTTELADELVGGVLSAGPTRLTAAGQAGIPQVISVGATDMVNFWAMASVPPQFRGRILYKHNENVTLMRTTAEECRRIGEEIGNKAAAARGPVAVLLPLRGVSAIDKQGEPFDDPEARQALFQAVRRSAGAIDVIEIDAHINDPVFAEQAARKLIELVEGH
jgi:uncharacterized protein (UPF0261 family)